MKIIFKKYPILILIILLAFGLRLYKITNPILDWHSWRQADTASVTREFVKSDLNPLYPKYHDLSNIPSGMENPEGYRMVEFPIYNLITASILKTVPQLQLEATSRVISILFSLGTLISIFFLTRSYFGKKAAYFASFFFAVIPYSVFYSRTVLPEPTMLFFMVFSLLMFRYFTKRKQYRCYFLSVISLAFAFLLKPFVVFLAPVYLGMMLEEGGLKFFKDFRIYLYLILSVTPFLIWRKWISGFPEGIPASDWLFNGNGIRFRPAWIRWLGYERLTKLILGFAGVIYLPISFLNQLKNKRLFLPSWWLSIFLYFAVIATGNVQHDYYQFFIMPVVVITLAHGLLVLDKFISEKFNAIVSIFTTIAIVSTMLFFSYHEVKGYFNINHPEQYEAGQAVDRLLPQDALVIAPNMGDTAFLFQTNRKGWPIGGQIEEKIKLGATHYVTTAMDKEAEELEQKYMIVEKTEKYLILNLTESRKEEL